MMQSGNLSSAWSLWSPEQKAGYCKRCQRPAWSSPPLPRWTKSTNPNKKSKQRVTYLILVKGSYYGNALYVTITMQGESQKGVWLNLHKWWLRFQSIMGPSGACLPHLAPQKRLGQSCLIAYHTEINMQRCQEVLGRCLTSSALKKQAYALLAALAVKSGRKVTRLHTNSFRKHNNTNRQKKNNLLCQH